MPARGTDTGQAVSSVGEGDSPDFGARSFVPSTGARLVNLPTPEPRHRPLLIRDVLNALSASPLGFSRAELDN
jgi:hypothetical protein